jgi:hypothetical protein
LLIAVAADGLFFPQRVALGLDARESTPGFKRQAVVLAAETRSFNRASIVMREVLGLQISTNTIERICLEVGNDLEAAQESDWKNVLTGEVIVPDMAIAEYDGGRIRTRQIDCGPGVHLSGKGWNETKNAILVSATSTISEVDPEPNPPACFLNPKHVAKLTETAEAKENAGPDEALPDQQSQRPKRKAKKPPPKHRPKRLVRTVLSSMQNSHDFGEQMAREARRRRFFDAARRAFLGDGLACNWSIHETHFSSFTPILDFVHAVAYVFLAARLCFVLPDEAWATYTRWMTTVWRGKVGEVIEELQAHQQRLGAPPEDVAADDPRERLRRVIQYLINNRHRMKYDEYRKQGLPVTSAWMESAVKEMNYRVKGTEMFWNHPAGAEAILRIKAASLSDDGRLTRLLSRRPGCATVRRPSQPLAQAA